MNTHPSTTQPHNHAHCIAEALEHAQSYCQEQGLRLTAIRQRVLELIWGSHRPSKAYDLLNQISQERGQTAPPTVYRALDFLLEAELIHKIESLNAFIGCSHPEMRGAPTFLICQNCEAVLEVPSPQINRAIEQAAQQAGFTANEEVIEISGTCQQCQAS